MYSDGLKIQFYGGVRNMWDKLKINRDVLIAYFQFLAYFQTFKKGCSNWIPFLNVSILFPMHFHVPFCTCVYYLQLRKVMKTIKFRLLITIFFFFSYIFTLHLSITTTTTTSTRIGDRMHFTSIRWCYVMRSCSYIILIHNTNITVTIARKKRKNCERREDTGKEKKRWQK